MGWVSKIFNSVFGEKVEFSDRFNSFEENIYIFGRMYQRSCEGQIVPAVIPMWINTKCECTHPKNINIVTACRIKSYDAFSEMCDRNGYKIVKSDLLRSGIVVNGRCDFELEINGKNILVPIVHGFWKKEACISCGTCIGWSFKGSRSKFAVNNPWSFYKLIVDNIVGKDIKDLMNIEIAKDICGVS